MNYPNDCIFCRIASGRQENEEIIYKDNLVIAFLDRFRQPSLGGHILVIPRDHYENIWTLPENLGGPLMNATQLLSKVVKDVIPCSGIRVWIANGRSAGQEIPHLHIHIFPCKSVVDRIKYTFPPLIGKQRLSEAALAEMAKPIRSRIEEIMDQRSQ